jgi:hypothetical protein
VAVEETEEEDDAERGEGERAETEPVETRRRGEEVVEEEED